MRVAAAKRFRAWLLLATFVASFVSTGLSLNHLDIVDTACGGISLSTGPDEAQLTTPSTTVPQHCPVCHFLRAVSGASAATQADLVVQDGLSIEFVAATQVPRAVDPITRSSRGPPAHTLTVII